MSDEPVISKSMQRRLAAQKSRDTAIFENGRKRGIAEAVKVCEGVVAHYKAMPVDTMGVHLAEGAQDCLDGIQFILTDP
jgi:hypothetical protein